jgi:hypothetical protein
MRALEYEIGKLAPVCTRTVVRIIVEVTAKHVGVASSPERDSVSPAADVSRVQWQVPRGNEIRNAKTPAERRLIGYERVVVEANPGAEIPVTVVHLILNVEGRLDVPPLRLELKIDLCAGIELRRIGDVVREGFVNRREERAGPGLRVVMTVMPRDIAAHVALGVAPILIDDHRRRQ